MLVVRLLPCLLNLRHNVRHHLYDRFFGQSYSSLDLDFGADAVLAAIAVDMDAQAVVIVGGRLGLSCWRVARFIAI